MNKTTNTTLVLVAAGLLTGIGTSTEVAAEVTQCQLEDPDTDDGGEVTLTLAQLQNAQQGPSGARRVFVPPSALAGIDVPSGVTVVKVRLTHSQYVSSVQMAQSGTTGKVTFSVHSEVWVDDAEQDLIGGFDVTFSGTFCRYTEPTEPTWS